MSRAIDEFRRAIWERDGGLCGICGLTVPLIGLHLDHIVQRAEGGLDDAANLRPTHARCNQRRARRYYPRRTPEGDLVFPIAEVAQQIGVASSQLVQLRDAGLLQAYRSGGYGLMYVSPIDAARVLREWAMKEDAGDVRD